jgi:hypothetical protein
MKRKIYAIATVVLSSPAMLGTFGCGGSDHLPRGAVTGSVTLDGKPLDGGILLFRPAQGRAGRGEIKDGKIVKTGTYEEEDGIVLGPHKIGIQPLPETMPVTFDRMEDPSQPGTAKRERPPAYATNTRSRKSMPIPAKYQDPDRSGITVDITDGDNELTLELTSR